MRREYDDRGNTIYRRFINGFEAWYKYDENNHLISSISSHNNIYWFSRKIAKEEFEQIKFNNREPISRFELMEL